MCIYIQRQQYLHIGSKLEPTVAEEVFAGGNTGPTVILHITPQVAQELSVDVDMQQALPEECFDFVLPISYEMSVNNYPLPICNFPHKLYSSYFRKC